jgi:iron complex outermembrane receptor protein
MRYFRRTDANLGSAASRGWLLAGAAACIGLAGSAHAQSADAPPSATAQQPEDADENDGGPSTIVVTAERRATDLQDTPISVVAITSEIAEAKGIEDLEDLSKFTPNLSITPSRGGGNNTAYFVIRGIGGGGGATGERGVGLYIDGIYMPRTSGAVLRVLDIDRIEVLRGPQGTLFGRNSTGGAIRIFSKQPTDQLEGYVRGTIGNQDRADIMGSINIPVAEGFALRGQAAYLSQGGFVARGTEMLGEERDFVGRLQARIEPSDRVRATFGFLYNDGKSNGTPYVMTEFDMRPGIDGVLQGNYGDWINDAFKAAGGPPLAAYNDSRIVTGDPYRASSLCFIDDFNPDYDPACNQTLKDNFWQADANVEVDLGGEATLTSVTGFSKLKHRGTTDFQVLGTEARTENVDSEVFYQELQINAALLAGAIDLVAGGNYFREDSSAPNWNVTRRGTSVYPSNPGNPPNADAGLFRTADTITKQLSDSLGVFLSATWHATDRLNITAGARHAVDMKDYSQTRYPATDFIPAPGTSSTTVNAHHTFRAIDWRGTVDYHLTDDIMAYGTVSKAYKAGQFSYSIVSWTAANKATGAAQSEGIRPIPNEQVVNYEAGLRMTLFDRLRLNPTAFLMDYTNRQAAVQVTCGTGTLVGIAPGGPQCPVGFLIQVQNQGDVRLEGFEVDAQLQITRDLSLDGGLAVTEPTLKNAPAGTVNLFPDVPSPTFNVGATWSPDTPVGRLTLNASYAYVGEQATHPTEGTDSSYTLPAYGIVNARAQLRLERLPVTITAFANNLLDEVYATYAQRFGGGFWDSGAGTGLAAPPRSALSEVRGRPREIGLTLQYDF